MTKGDRYIRDRIEYEEIDDTGTSSPIYKDYPKNKWVVHVDPDGVFVVICAVCQENNRRADDNMAYLGGKWYHAESCYHTIFAPCANKECKKYRLKETENDDGLCYDCYMKKYNLKAVTLRF
jgi:hypothetical protein